MKKVRMNISYSRFILAKLKIFGEIVTTFIIWATGSGLVPHSSCMKSSGRLVDCFW